MTKSTKRTRLINKWRKTVVHIECAKDSVSSEKRLTFWKDLNRQWREGKVNKDEIDKFWLAGSRDIRCQGTAVFLCHNSKHYLITARHVIWDEEKRGWYIFDSKGLKPQLTKGSIHDIIFAVPSFDDFIKKSFPGVFLMNLRAGVPSMTPFTVSNPELDLDDDPIDLAIISLDQRDSRFTKELFSRGYKPIKLSDISTEPLREGDELFSVGFPSSSLIGKRHGLSIAKKAWMSECISLPTFAFGRVSMWHNKLSYFWCDISDYPGNSGGPIIHDEKMAGIVIEQDYIKGEVTEKVTEKDKYSVKKYKFKKTPFEALIRVPFAKVTKSEYVKKLLDDQIVKDKRAP